MTKPSEVKGLLSELKKAADSLLSRIHLLDEKIESLYKKRSSIISEPLSKDDFINLIRADIQGKARNSKVSLQRNLLEREKVNFNAVGSAKNGGLAVQYLTAGLSNADTMNAGAFFYYFEDVLMEGVARAMEGHGWPADALSVAQRTEALKLMDDELAALTAERDALAEEIASCGFTG